MNPEIDATVHLDQLRADAQRIAELIEVGPVDAEIPACPGWTVTDLVVHLGGVHRWAEEAVRIGSAPPRRGPALVPTEELADWFRRGADDLANTLAGVDPSAPGWHPFAGPQLAGCWHRRQAHETMIHRHDIEDALGRCTELPALAASDAIDEHLGIMLPQVLHRRDLAPPEGSIHYHCTDVPGEWWLAADSEGLVLRREHAKGDAAVRGPAATILLRLMQRRTDDADLEVIGDAAVASHWLSIPGP